MADIIASPSVRKLALDRGVDIARLAQDLGRQTIGREDVEGTTMREPDGLSYWDVDHGRYGAVTSEPLSRFDRVAAANLAAAQALIPAVTHHDQADSTRIETFRSGLKPEAKARGTKLTALAFHVMILARCLRDFPRFNASLSRDGTELVLKDYVHIGIAVDTAHGLMVPVLRHADRLGLWDIAAKITDLAQRAHDRKISPDDMSGASMTITNLGGIGGTGFTPIVNPPEVAILGITRMRTVSVWDNGTPVPTPITPLSLTYDHRVINGALAAKFTASYCNLMENPRLLLV